MLVGACYVRSRRKNKNMTQGCSANSHLSSTDHRTPEQRLLYDSTALGCHRSDQSFYPQQQLWFATYPNNFAQNPPGMHAFGLRQVSPDWQSQRIAAAAEPGYFSWTAHCCFCFLFFSGWSHWHCHSVARPKLQSRAGKNMISPFFWSFSLLFFLVFFFSASPFYAGFEI